MDQGQLYAHPARIFQGTGKLVQCDVRFALNDLDQEVHMRCQFADRTRRAALTFRRNTTATPMLSD